jgi:hypothetical protein
MKLSFLIKSGKENKVITYPWSMKSKKKIYPNVLPTSVQKCLVSLERQEERIYALTMCVMYI